MVTECSSSNAFSCSEANQGFTHIATPEENSYIEAFHSIVQREIVDRFEFDSFYYAKNTLAAHRNWYDSRRRHRNIGMTPLQKWEQNIHITEHKRAERKELQDITEMAAELPGDINNYYTTSSLLLSN